MHPDLKKERALSRWLTRFETSLPLRIIQQCFTYLIPILVIGSFSLVLFTLPVPAYLHFIEVFADGFLIKLFTAVNAITLNCLSLFVVISMPIAYCSVTDTPHTAYIAFVSLASYLAYFGNVTTIAEQKAFTPQWTFIALVISTLVCIVLTVAIKANKKYALRNTGVNFYISTYYLLVAAGLILFFAAIGRIASGSQNLNFLSAVFEELFGRIGRNYGSAMLFQFLVHLLWMFGLHGSNILDGVATGVFEQGITINQDLALAGLAPTEIFTKSFFDVFVLMGGCGVSICIVAALLIGGHRQDNRMVARGALIPCLFNISEMVVYGLPIILNPVMLIPFLLTPLVLLTTSALATTLGILPIVSHSVTWTTPLLLSGYYATGTIAGSLVQVFNLALGTLIYLPFVRLSERIADGRFQSDIRRATDELLENESAGRECHPLTQHSAYQSAMRSLLRSFYRDYEAGSIRMFYQPQVDNEGRTIGAEALLRWNCHEAGFIAPPLIIAMAKDDSFGEKLGYSILEWAAADLERMNHSGFHNFKVSANVAAFQLADPDFCKTLREILSRYDFGDCRFSLEITEREAMYITAYISNVIEELKQMGVTLMLDDFGMGHNSITYITRDQFEFIKLDGALVRDILKNPRSQDIVRGICSLAQELGCKVVAEYVESRELRDTLEQLGCYVYQGYYYGKALPLEEFLHYPRESVRLHNKQ